MILLHCERQGQGRPLVLLHGWAMNACVWQDLTVLLQDRHQIYAIDLPGHGDSDWSANDGFALAPLAAQLASSVPERALWVGWSLGVLPVIQLALTYPQQVAGIVLLAGTPRFLQDHNWPGMAPEILARFQEALQEDAEACMQSFAALQALASEHHRAVLVRVRQLLRHKPKPRPAALQAGLALLRDTDMRTSLARVSCPSLVLLGKQDHLIPIEIKKPLAILWPDSHIQEIAGAAHLPQLSHPAEVAQALTHFSEICL